MQVHLQHDGLRGLERRRLLAAAFSTTHGRRLDWTGLRIVCLSSELDWMGYFSLNVAVRAVPLGLTKREEPEDGRGPP